MLDVTCSCHTRRCVTWLLSISLEPTCQKARCKEKVEVSLSQGHLEMGPWHVGFLLCWVCREARRGSWKGAGRPAVWGGRSARRPKGSHRDGPRVLCSPTRDQLEAPEGDSATKAQCRVFPGGGELHGRPLESVRRRPLPLVQGENEQSGRPRPLVLKAIPGLHFSSTFL